MFDQEQYELVDFGAGRKLERFGGELLDRPSPAADGIAIAHPELWASTSARFDLARGGKGRWIGEHADAQLASTGEDRWSVCHGESRLLLQLSESGNVGVFPEQASNWDWIADQVRHCRHSGTSGRPRVLNLFAYTGGASLAAAAAGAEVTHVDASGPTVAMARRNAEASGLADLPIRWLVEDALKFMTRERKRGNYYDGVIADPPTYGHGPKGRPFKFKQHLTALLESCGELLGAADPDGPTGRFMVFSCHTPGFGQADAVSAVADVLPDADGARLAARPLAIESADGRKLAAGVSVRWSAVAH